MSSDTSQFQLLVEQLYESERLTDALTDNSARMLLSWAEAQINSMASFAPEQLDQAARHLHQIMRSINRLVGQHAELSEEEAVQQLLELVDQAGRLAVEKAAASPSGHETAASTPDTT